MDVRHGLADDALKSVINNVEACSSGMACEGNKVDGSHIQYDESKEIFTKDENEPMCENGASEEGEVNTTDIHTQCPCVGMEFNSHEEAYDFYNRYAASMGFSVRKSTTNRSRITSEIIGRTFCCSLEGVRDSRAKAAEERIRNRADTRTGCKATMVVRKRKKEETWNVSKVIENHNHALVTPSKRHRLRSQRSVGSTQGHIMDNMLTAGIRTNLMVSFLASEAGGIQNVGFTKKDANNYLTSKRQKELANGDAQAVLDHLRQQQMENPAFFYTIQIDSEGRMTNFFWADARSRMDYHYFGDVVCFDPTYGTNKYKMPFVPIVGINHHYQTVLFGGALLYSETEETFVWVMKSWMVAMEGKQPKIILTDQESAIGGAIKQVLPEARHYYCSWHIGRNAMKHLAHEINSQPNFYSAFNKCIYSYETIPEFESGWDTMIKEYNLEENKWLINLFEKREKWASVYRRDIFCGGMSTTQRSESINSYFDKYLKKGMPLWEFMKQYERAVVDRREEENNADYDTTYSNQVLRFSMKIEKEASNIYTKAIFKKFQEQLILGLSYRHKKVEDDGMTFVYKVWMEGYEYKARTVTFELSTTNVQCSCQMFAFSGYLCRHALKIFVVEDVQNLSEQYILKRWTREAKSGSLDSRKYEGIQLKVKESVTLRYSKLCQDGVHIASKASHSDVVFEVATKGFDDTLKNVEAAIRKLSLNLEPQNEDKGTTGVEAAYPDNILEPLLDPLAKNVKGRPKTFLNVIDKIKKKKTKANKKGLQKKGNTSTRSKASRKNVSQSNSLLPTHAQISSQGNLDHAHGRLLAHESILLDLNNSP